MIPSCEANYSVILTMDNMYCISTHKNIPAKSAIRGYFVLQRVSRTPSSTTSSDLPAWTTINPLVGIHWSPGGQGHVWAPHFFFNPGHLLTNTLSNIIISNGSFYRSGRPALAMVCPSRCWSLMCRERQPKNDSLRMIQLLFQNKFAYCPTV